MAMSGPSLLTESTDSMIHGCKCMHINLHIMCVPVSILTSSWLVDWIVTVLYFVVLNSVTNVVFDSEELPT